MTKASLSFPFWQPGLYTYKTEGEYLFPWLANPFNLHITPSPPHINCSRKNNTCHTDKGERQLQKGIVGEGAGLAYMITCSLLFGPKAHGMLILLTPKKMQELLFC